jgi:predicted SnoaL-like aldol condensation-catalyzing enzyme
MMQTPSARERFDELVSAEATRGADAEPSLIEANRALVRRYFDMWNSGDGSVADAILGPTYLDHAHAEVIGPAALRSLVPRFRATNPGSYMTIEIVAANGEYVAIRNCIARTVGGKTTTSDGIAVFRAAAGKLAEHWSCYPVTEEVDSGPREALSTREGWLSFRA